MVNLRSTIVFVSLVLSLVVIVIHFLYFKYTFPGVTVDEASFFSPAYNLAKKGNLLTTVHSISLPGGQKFTYWMPPLYMIVLGGFLRLTGATVFNAKLFSLLITFLSCYPISLLAKNKLDKILLCSLFLISPFIVISSSYIRMEAWSVFLVFVLIYSVYSKRSPFVLGIISGLMIMSHPMIIGNVIACGLMLLLRSLKNFIFYSIALFITILPYIYFAFQDIDIFYSQMQLQLQRKFGHGLDLDLSYLIQVFPFVFFSYIIFLKKGIENDFKKFLIIGLTITFILFIKSGEYNYHVYLVPFIITGFSILLNRNFFYKYHTLLFAFSFFYSSILLFQKYKKNYYKIDQTYYEVTSMLESNPVWKGKLIFVDGLFDVSKYLISKGEQVQRFNAVARRNDQNWIEEFNCLIAVNEIKKPQKLIVDKHLSGYKLSYKGITSDSLTSISIYVKK